MVRRKPEIKADHFDEHDREIRDTLIACADEAACAELIAQGVREVQESWSDSERIHRLGHHRIQHLEIQEICEGNYSHNRKPGIGREKL